ncbi:hypothetical protein IKQ21_02875 [bacterium]|nr:hypothetical protein [bacterium]
MSLVNLISAIGNNSSIYPLIVRDCGIEVPSKVALTYKQNLKDSPEMAKNATRERFIDEYTTSAVWLGGIPLINKVCDWGISKFGYNPAVNTELYKERSNQGIKFNIEKFKGKADKEVAELEKALTNKATYQRLQAGKFVLSTAIPIALMGYIIPKLNFKLTEILRKKQVQKEQSKQSTNVSFKGLTSVLANMSTVNKMAITDGGYAVGRVTTGRNKYEQMEMAFKMAGMIFLNFIAPFWIATGLDKLSKKIFNLNVNLDPKLLNNGNELIGIELPKENIIEYLDKKPDSKFSKLCEEYCGVKYLKNRVRDPRAYVNEKKIKSFQQELEKFIKEAGESGDVKKYSKKALKAKSVNILANIGISSFLLAVVLPKLTFYLREKVTGSKAEPGLL